MVFPACGLIGGRRCGSVVALVGLAASSGLAALALDGADRRRGADDALQPGCRCSLADVLTVGVRELNSNGHALGGLWALLQAAGADALLPEQEGRTVQGGCTLLCHVEAALVPERLCDGAVDGGGARGDVRLSARLLDAEELLARGFRSLLERASSLSSSGSKSEAGLVNMPHPLLSNTSAQVFQRHLDRIRTVLRTSAQDALSSRMTLYGGASMLPCQSLAQRVSTVVARRVKLCLDNVAVTLTLNFQHLWFAYGAPSFDASGRAHSHADVFREDLLRLAPRGARFSSRQRPRRGVTAGSPLESAAGSSGSQVGSPRFLYSDIFGGRARILEHLIANLRRPWPLRIAELGVADGNTTEHLARQATRLGISEYFAVDPYIGGDDAYEIVAQRLEPWQGAPVHLVRGTSMEASRLVADDSLDLVFVDGNHDIAHVIEDIDTWALKLRPSGGLLVGHDFHFSHLPVIWTASIACHCLDRRQALNIAFDSVWWCERNAYDYVCV